MALRASAATNPELPCLTAPPVTATLGDVQRGADTRFDAIRGNCCYFLGFWVWQMAWVFVVSLTVLFINAKAHKADDVPLGGLDFAGWALFVGGFALQVRRPGSSGCTAVARF